MASATAAQGGPTIPGMEGGVLVGVPFIATTLAEVNRLGATKVFVLANNSSRALCAPLVAALEEAGVLASPLSTDVGMGGGEKGLLKVCDLAVAAGADALVTVGGGAVQDAGKLVRLWLGGSDGPGATAVASVDGIKAVGTRDPFPLLPPQIAVPNSFAMAELTSVAGLTTSSGSKSGVSHPGIMATTTIFDPVLAYSLPDWVRFGTALRCVEHAVGATTHPKATDEIRNLALQGLALVHRGIKVMVDDPTSETGMIDVYTGGWYAVRALNTGGCYPAVGHLIANAYSARYGVHQGACSGVLCARILDFHHEASAEHQARIAAVLSDGDATNRLSAARLVANLIGTLPGVAKEHAETGMDVNTLTEFAEAIPLARLNTLCPKPFASIRDVHAMLTRPLDELV
jgi:alcohol dehydrogenase class IV